MPAQLQVHSVLLGLFKMEGLMVKQDNIVALVNALHELFNAFAMAVGAVVASYNGHAINVYSAVTKETDASLADEVNRFVDARDVLMVSKAC